MTSRNAKTVLALRPKAAGTVEVLIYGPIGDSWFMETVDAKNFIDELAQTRADELVIRINSPGGSVPDGCAIYNAIRQHPASRKITQVDGQAASIASLIAMAGDTLNMFANTTLLVHAPWAVVGGNENELRQFADSLHVYAESMATSYAAKSGKSIDEVMGLLSDGKDHLYTAEQAVAEGFADAVIEAAANPAVPVDPADPDEDAAGIEISIEIIEAFRAHAPALAAQMRRNAFNAVAARAMRKTGSAEVHGESETHLAREAGPASASTSRGSSAAQPQEEIIMSQQPTAAVVADPNAAVAAAQTALRERNTSIQAALKPVMEIAGVRALYEEALLDPSMTLDTINARALALAGAGASPSAGTHVEAGRDQSEKDVQAMSEWLLARAEAERPEGKLKLGNAAPNNPFRGYSLYAMAEHCVRAQGVNTARMNRSEIVALAMRPKAAAGLTTSDFPNLLENTLNKLLVAAYTGAPTTWQRFCRVTDLIDFRANPRYRIGTFSDLKEVNEAGDYEQGTVSDAERESITGKRKGRILVVSREMIVNDDLQAFADIARGLGAVANRTVDKDVFALFALNGGNGPNMGDGKSLFHADHANVAAVGAAPGVAPFEAARVQMAQQKDPSGNDFLDIRPDIWLGPIGIGGSARVTNNSLYDPDAASKLQRPNIVNGLFSDIVDTPRLAGTPWYALANPEAEPVFEVGFVGGQRLPIVEQEKDFDSDGLRWKVVLEYGVAATGWRGAIKNAGA